MSWPPFFVEQFPLNQTRVSKGKHSEKYVLTK